MKIEKKYTQYPELNILAIDFIEIDRVKKIEITGTIKDTLYRFRIDNKERYTKLWETVNKFPNTIRVYKNSNSSFLITTAQNVFEIKDLYST